MSVSFYPAIQDALTRIACSCGDVVADTLYVSRSEAYNALYVANTATVPVCGDWLCAAYSASFVEVEPTPEINLANPNAREVLDILGILVDEEWSDRCAGSMDADEFLGRVLMADAVQPFDAGRPAFQQGNQVDCGRAEGYLNARVSELREVAEYARAHQLQVCWG